MSPEETERLLASAPTQQLSPEAEQRILSAVVACSPPPSVNWWMRRVPLWQAAAACILLCAATFGLTRGVGRITVGNEPKSLDPSPAAAGVAGQPKSETTLVRVDQPLFVRPARPPYHADISRWSLQFSNHKKRN